MICVDWYNIVLLLLHDDIVFKDRVTPSKDSRRHPASDRGTRSVSHCPLGQLCYHTTNHPGLSMVFYGIVFPLRDILCAQLSVEKTVMDKDGAGIFPMDKHSRKNAAAHKSRVILGRPTWVYAGGGKAISPAGYSMPSPPATRIGNRVANPVRYSDQAVWICTGHSLLDS